MSEKLEKTRTPRHFHQGACNPRRYVGNGCCKETRRGQASPVELAKWQFVSVP